VGDTLQFLTPSYTPNPLFDSIVRVDSVNLIMINNTQRHQYFYHVDLKDGIYIITEPGSIIEGIGNTHGFLYANLNSLAITVSRDIECVSLNGSHIFGTDSVCFQPGHFSGISTITDKSISVYEFQNGDQITFQLSNPNHKSIQLSIYNFLGQLEKTLVANSSQILSFSRSEFFVGTHIATITSNGGIISSLKFNIF
jgi:hypothetical protein